MINKQGNIIIKIFLVVGVILRVITTFFSSIYVGQHDVLMDGGHFHYACHIFSVGSLPLSKYGEFYQPPLNAIMQSLWMKCVSNIIKPTNSLLTIFNDYISGNYQLINDKPALSDYMLKLYSSTKWLSCIYSIIILVIIFHIVNILVDSTSFHKNYDGARESSPIQGMCICIVGICAIYPGMILMASQYNNDPLSYVFFFLSIYLAIKWFINKSLITIILLALYIGFGMLTKISVGIVAIIIGPMMIYVLINSIRRIPKNDSGLTKLADTEDLQKLVHISDEGMSDSIIGTNYVNANESKKFVNIFMQLIVFALIVFPLGLSYALRNYMLFKQPFNYVRTITENNPIYTGDIDIVKRIFSIPFDRIISKTSSIYHDIKEYNIWIDLFKTSTFDEYNFGNEGVRFAISYIMYFINIGFHILSFVAFFVVIIKIIRARKSDRPYGAYYIVIMLYVIAIVSYILFNINYPASCTSNYRYIAYITFAESALVSLAIL